MMRIHEEATCCLLCIDAPCSRVCKKGDPARAIRAIRFGNERLAGRWVAECSDEELEQAGVPAGLVRMSCGLEDKEDLIADLKQALDTLV